MTATALKCACPHCNCTVQPEAGYLLDGVRYCSPACATHDHEHPTPCCVANTCCG
ncbi:metallothionein [Candidatus Cyanaurora vandensis]|uniref:metallothionein n=1 Tax=Candidatus Cyanaurora vandensis TaxID=2714958 RepID=UPI00257D6321|nr:metallothionein [Candidatus Cyanaurora vandensis]